MNRLPRMQAVFISLLAVFLVLDSGLIAYLVWGGNKESRRIEEKQLQDTLRLEKLQVTPLNGIDKKLMDTRADIKKFYAERVPTLWSQISSELHKLEQENGISEKSSIRYAPEDTGLPDLQRVKIETDVAGDYVKIAHFINALERDKLLFLIQQVSVTAQAGTVELEIKFETFLKGAA
jgi:type IV pilus assembly protein PilO